MSRAKPFLFLGIRAEDAAADNEYEAMLTHKVAIGRAWPALPHHVRVTIGTRDEMAKFKAAFDRVMGA